MYLGWLMLSQKRVRLAASVVGLGVLFFLSAAQFGLLVGWCGSCSAIVRHSAADIWIMAPQTQAFDYGTPIPNQRIYQARSCKGVVDAEGMIMAWNTWQRTDGKRCNVELVGLDDACFAGPWRMQEGEKECVHLPDAVIVDELFMESLGVKGIGDEAELYGTRAIVKGISSDVRTMTASPFVFASIETARRFDKRYNNEEITYVLVKADPKASIEDVKEALADSMSHVEVLTREEFATRTMKYWMLETGLGITVVLTAILGLTVGVVVTSQTLFTVTQECLGNYATLLALGFRKWKMIRMILSQSVMMGSTGTVIGSTFFYFAARASSRTPIPLETTPAIFASLVAVNLLVCLCSSLLAVRTVLKLDPVTVFGGQG